MKQVRIMILQTNATVGAHYHQSENDSMEQMMKTYAATFMTFPENL